MAINALIMINGVFSDGSLQDTEPDTEPVRTTHYLDGSMHKTDGEQNG